MSVETVTSTSHVSLAPAPHPPVADQHGDHRYRSAAVTAMASLLGRPLNLAMSLVMVGMLVRMLGEAEYGIWTVCYTLALWFGVLDCGVSYSLLNRLTTARAHADTAAYRTTVTTALVFLSLIGLVVLAVTTLIGTLTTLPSLLDPNGVVRESDTRACIVIFGLFAACYIPMQAYDRIILSHQEGWLNVASQVLAAGLGFVGVLVALAFSTSLPIVAGAWVAGTLLAMGAVRQVAIVRYGIASHTEGSLFSGVELSRLVSTGILFVISTFSGQLALQSDPLILTLAENATGHAVSPAAAADLAVPMRLFNVINAFATLVINPLWPAYADAAARGDRAWLRKTLVLSSLTATLGCLAVVAPCLLFGKHLIRFWVGDTIHVPESLMLAYGVWTVAMTLSHSLTLYLQGTGRLRFLSMVSVLFVTTVLVAKLVGLYAYGSTGMVAATAAAVIVAQILPIVCYLLIRDRSVH